MNATTRPATPRPAAGLTLDHLRYLQREYARELDPASLKWSPAVPSSIRFLRLNCVPPPAPAQTSRTVASSPSSRQVDVHFRMADVLTGLHDLGGSVLYTTDSDGSRVRVGVGTCKHEGFGSKAAAPAPASTVLSALLDGTFPGVQHASMPAEEPWTVLARGDPGALALAFGTPFVPPAHEAHNGIDRILRGMRGSPWIYAVVAAPLPRTTVHTFASAVLNELRRTLSARKSAGTEPPVSERYEELLRGLLERLERAASVGAWHAVTYLAASGAEDLHRLTALARASFARPGADPDPYDVSIATSLTKHGRAFALPQSPSPEPPSALRYPFALGSLVDSTELAVLVDPPREEHPGYEVQESVAFDCARVSPGNDKQGTIVVGEIHDRRVPTGATYQIGLRDLTRHSLIVGSTGSGKTNTVFHLLRELAALEIPFLVIEPTKSEYRGLLHHPELGKRLHVHTAGLETVAPLRLNPFEFPSGISLGEHLDWLRSAFAVSLGLWTPLPQVLERCLFEVYEDAGWDPVQGSNPRIETDEDRADAFPTLTDLQRKIPGVVAALGYSPETSGEIRGALETRIRSLRTGGRGRMLDGSRSTPADQLFDRPVLLEMEAIGADEDKAFVMALLLLRLTEHRRCAARSRGLAHVLVLEEAHRILARTGPRSEERSADPRGRAVESFAHLMAEVRAYGQGVVLVDQIPTRLAPDALKNTNLKIAHRLLAADDREAVGGAMAMTNEQVGILPAFGPGEAAIHGPGDDRPLMIQVPLVEMPGDRPSEDVLRARAKPEEDADSSPMADRAREVADSDAFQGSLSRGVQTILEEASGLEPVFAGWRSHVPPQILDEKDRRTFELALARLGAERLARRRGAEAGWPFARGREFARRLTDVFEKVVEGKDTSKALAAFRELAFELHARAHDPYPSCSQICADRPGLCLHRLAAAEIVEDGRFRAPWNQADSASAVWTVALDAGFEVIQFPDQAESGGDGAQDQAATRRASLCVAQQLAYSDPTMNRQRALARTTRLIEMSKQERGE